MGSNTNPSAFKTSDKGEAKLICSTKGDITVGPVAKTIALYTPATGQDKPAKR